MKWQFLWHTGVHPQRRGSTQPGHGSTTPMERQHQQDLVLREAHVHDRRRETAEYQPASLHLPHRGETTYGYQLHVQCLHGGVQDETRTHFVRLCALLLPTVRLVLIENYNCSN